MQWMTVIMQENRYAKVSMLSLLISRIIRSCNAALQLTVCAARTEGLVRYPSTLAPLSGSKIVYTHCADNAQRADNADLSVTCSSDGVWSGSTPECQCDTGYSVVTDSDIGYEICQGSIDRNTDTLSHIYPIIAIPRIMCEARTEGLVYYPPTLAPFSGSVEVATQCADNAHSTSSTLNVECTSSGSWSGDIPQCACDSEYTEVNDGNVRGTCEGKLK